MTNPDRDDDTSECPDLEAQEDDLVQQGDASAWWRCLFRCRRRRLCSSYLGLPQTPKEGEDEANMGEAAVAKEPCSPKVPSEPEPEMAGDEDDQEDGHLLAHLPLGCDMPDSSLVAEERAEHCVEERPERQAEQNLRKNVLENARRKCKSTHRKDAEDSAMEAEGRIKKDADAKVKRANNQAEADLPFPANQTDRTHRSQAKERSQKKVEDIDSTISGDGSLQLIDERATNHAVDRIRKAPRSFLEDNTQKHAKKKIEKVVEDRIASKDAEERDNRQVDELAKMQSEKDEEARYAEENARKKAQDRSEKDEKETVMNEAEARANRSAEEARAMAEETAKKQAELIILRGAEERAKIHAERRAQIELEEEARRQVEEEARRDAEKRLQTKMEHRIRMQADRIMQEAEQRAKKHLEESARQHRKEPFKCNVDENARSEQEGRPKWQSHKTLSKEAEEKSMEEAEEKARQEIACDLSSPSHSSTSSSHRKMLADEDVSDCWFDALSQEASDSGCESDDTCRLRTELASPTEAKSVLLVSTTPSPHPKG